MTKFTKTLLLIILSLVCAMCFVACGDTPPENPGGNDEQNPPPQINKLEYNDKGDYIEITGIRIIYQADVVIPDEIDGKPVTTIADEAFSSEQKIANTKLATIAFGKNVTTIGKKAFSACNKLTTVTGAENVAYIGESAFENCTALVNFTLSGKVSIIEKKTFAGCKSLAGINLAGVTTINESAFQYCGTTAGKFDITNSKSISSIGITAFMGCALSTIELSTSLTKLETGAFTQSSIQTITLPRTIKVLAPTLFAECNKLTSVTLGDRTTEIGVQAFKFCPVLDNIELPSTLTTIASEAFYSCGSLSKITIPNKVSRIEARTFVRCSSLSEIIIGTGVKFIGEHAFGDGNDETDTTQTIEYMKFLYREGWDCYSGSLLVVELTSDMLEEGDALAETYWKHRHLSFQR